MKIIKVTSGLAPDVKSIYIPITQIAIVTSAKELSGSVVTLSCADVVRIPVIETAEQVVSMMVGGPYVTAGNLSDAQVDTHSDLDVREINQDIASDFISSENHAVPVSSELILELPITDFRPEQMRVIKRVSDDGHWWGVESYNANLAKWIEQKQHHTEQAAIDDANGWYPDISKTIAYTWVESHNLDEHFVQMILDKFGVKVVDRSNEPWSVKFLGTRKALADMLNEYWLTDGEPYKATDARFIDVEDPQKNMSDIQRLNEEIAETKGLIDNFVDWDNPDNFTRLSIKLSQLIVKRNQLNVT